MKMYPFYEKDTSLREKDTSPHEKYTSPHEKDTSLQGNQQFFDILLVSMSAIS